MSSRLWDDLSSRFNTHKEYQEIHPDAAVNIVVGWPHFFFHINTHAKNLGRKTLDILDFGCGSGSLCQELHKMGHRVVGYDHSLKMLELAKNNTPEEIEYVHSQIKELKHKDFVNRFDLVTALHSLEWISNINSALKDITQTLKKDGMFLMAIFPKKHVIESLKIKDLFEDFEDPQNPTKGVANFDGVKVPVYIREPKFFDNAITGLGFEKVLEYYPQYPQDFFTHYKWTGARYPEMVILAYKKL